MDPVIPSLILYLINTYQELTMPVPGFTVSGQNRKEKIRTVKTSAFECSWSSRKSGMKINQLSQERGWLGMNGRGRKWPSMKSREGLSSVCTVQL